MFSRDGNPLKYQNYRHFQHELNSFSEFYRSKLGQNIRKSSKCSYKVKKFKVLWLEADFRYTRVFCFTTQRKPKQRFPAEVNHLILHNTDNTFTNVMTNAMQDEQIYSSNPYPRMVFKFPPRSSRLEVEVASL